MDELFDTSDAMALAAAVAAGDVTAEEVVRFALDRIEARNPAVNAVVELRAEQALAEAAAGPTGPLAGVPFVIKDLGVDVAGMRSTGGSRLRAEVVATEDSTIVRRYKAAGLIVLGTTNVPELGRNGSTEPVLHGPTRNPHLPTHSAGGSSGGTAAAIAAGMVPAGHGNDGGGSLRIPASACGLVGLKPSRGRVPAHPRRGAFSYPAGINHAITRSVRDSALLLDIAAGPVAGAAYAAPTGTGSFLGEVGADPGRRRVAVSTTRPDGQPSDPECVAAVARTAALLADLGHLVVEATPDYPLASIQAASRIVMSVPLAADVDATLERFGRPLRDDDLEPFTRVLYDSAKSVTGTQYAAALDEVERVGWAMGAFFESHDLLLTPTMPVPPPALGVLDTTDPEAMYRHAGPIAALTSFCNFSGQPAISLPMARFASGLPLGVQLVAAYGGEGLLLRVAAQLEAAAPWPVTPATP